MFWKLQISIEDYSMSKVLLKYWKWPVSSFQCQVLSMAVTIHVFPAVIQKARKGGSVSSEEGV